MRRWIEGQPIRTLPPKSTADPTDDRRAILLFLFAAFTIIRGWSSSVRAIGHVREQMAVDRPESAIRTYRQSPPANLEQDIFMGFAEREEFELWNFADSSELHFSGLGDWIIDGLGPARIPILIAVTWNITASRDRTWQQNRIITLLYKL